MANPVVKTTIKGEDKLTPELKKINKALEDMNKTSLTKLAASFEIVTMAAKTFLGGISKVTNECKKLVTEYTTVERYNSRLIATWDNVGKSTGYTAKELLALADSLEKVTYFEAESIQTAAQTLASTQALNKEGFEKTLSLSVDLAEAMGTDVPNAASILSRALIAPEEGLGRLKTAGIAFTDAEKDLITKLQEEGKTWESQQVILDKVAEKYEGIAKAVADTDANKLTQINNTLGTIRENLGGSLLDVLSPALDSLYERLQDIEKWSTKNKDVTAVNKVLREGGSFAPFSDEAIANAMAAIEASPDYGENAKLNKNWMILYNEQQYRIRKAEFMKNRGLSSTDVNINTVPAENTSASAESSNIIEYAGLSASDLYNMEQLYLKKQEEALEEYKKKVVSVTQQIASTTTSLFSAVSNLITTSLDQQSAALEKEMETAKEAGTLTLEEEKKKQDEINELRRKSFEAEKANSIASALISGAESVVKFLADPGGYAGIALSVASGVTTALQVAAISQQQYTPMATGGIVTSPTHALVGEAGPEAIIPLTEGRNPLESSLNLTININGNAQEEDIYNAIERAQRTGLLPHWSYA